MDRPCAGSAELILAWVVPALFPVGRTVRCTHILASRRPAGQVFQEGNSRIRTRAELPAPHHQVHDRLDQNRAKAVQPPCQIPRGIQVRAIVAVATFVANAVGTGLRAFRFRRALARFRCGAEAAIDDLRLLDTLVRNWGNVAWSADSALLRVALRKAGTTQGPVLECGSAHGQPQETLVTVSNEEVEPGAQPMSGHSGSARASLRARRALAGALLAGVLFAGAAGTATAAELDSVRLRVGAPQDTGDIDGGALALTFTPDTKPAWLRWIGEDLHVEGAVSFWSDAGPDGDVYTTHLGPAWRFRPEWLGSRGFFEAGTSIAWVSERRVEGNDLGSRWHFTTHAMAGYLIGPSQRWHLGLRVRHTSNAGFGSPNPGLDIVMLEFGYRLSR